MSMRSVVDLLGHVKRRVRSDLRTDPYLRYVLIVAVVLLGFWFWHLIPNFATRDEHARLFDVLPAVGALVSEPGLKVFQEGVTQGKIYGATFYLNALALVPSVVFAAVTDQLSVFAPFYRPGVQVWPIETDLWRLWHTTPRWVWTSSLLLIRLFNVAFAVSGVYLSYRIGTELRDRATGRLAALLLSVTFGFIVMAHEGGEDVPSVLLLLLVVYLALRYVATGDQRYFLGGCGAGGFAIAFKLTGAVSVAVLGTAFLLRARNADTAWPRNLLRPRLLALGAGIGLGAIVLGYPSVLVSGPEPLIDRIARGTSNKLAGERGASWWMLRGYLHGFGLALFLAVLWGVAATLVGLRHRSKRTDGVVLVAVAVATGVGLLSWWQYVRLHHLLPTIPFLVLLLAVALGRLSDRAPTAGRVVVVGLLVSSALYAGYGTAGYASQPREEATNWLTTHASDNASIDVYKAGPQDAVVPHGMNTNHYGHRDSEGRLTRTATSYGEWMMEMPERCPEYVQLTYEDLLRLAPPTLNGRAQFYADHHTEREYVRQLLTNETDSYEIAATFGPRPRFLDDQSQPLLPELLRVGIVPRTIQHGDEQDLGPHQYVVIVERTRPCS